MKWKVDCGKNVSHTIFFQPQVQNEVEKMPFGACVWERFYLLRIKWVLEFFEKKIQISVWFAILDVLSHDMMMCRVLTIIALV